MVTCSYFLVQFIVAYEVQDVQTVTLEVHAQEVARISTSIDTSADAGSDTSIDTDIDASTDTSADIGITDTSVAGYTSVTDTSALCAAPHARTIGYAMYECADLDRDLDSWSDGSCSQAFVLALVTDGSTVVRTVAGEAFQNRIS